MMNDLPPIRTAPAAQQRRPRSQRWQTQAPQSQAQRPITQQQPAEWQHFWPEQQMQTAYPVNAAASRQPRSAPAQRTKARRKKRGVPFGVIAAVLGLLTVALVFAISSYSDAVGKLNDAESLLEAQEQREKDWAEKVASYQVKYRELIEYYAALNSLDPAYVSAIIKQESNFDPRAVSSKDARGLMQFMPDTFSWVRNNCGYRNADISILYEPEPSIKMGCYLLRYIINHLGTDDPILVACAYHAGWGSVSSWLKNYSTDGKTLTLSQIPKDDTRHYAKKVLEGYAIYQQYQY